uniref:DUF3108 domain-containing protein n=1 Tax=Elaeophora elaphi TaxID=1147741 RepID=A0A0R3S6Q1_9BILA
MQYYGFFCLIISYSLLSAQTDIPTQVVTLLDKKSYVEYKLIEWNYADDGPQLTLPIRFRTRSINGRLITVSARANEDSIFILSAYVDNAAVVVDLIDNQRKVIQKTRKQLFGSITYFHYFRNKLELFLEVNRKIPEIVTFSMILEFLWFMVLGVNNGIEYSMSIQLNLEKKMLKMVYGEGAMDSYDFIDDIEIQDRVQLAITTGSSGIPFSFSATPEFQLYLKLKRILPEAVWKHF